MTTTSIVTAESKTSRLIKIVQSIYTGKRKAFEILTTVNCIPQYTLKHGRQLSVLFFLSNLPDLI
jgi:hypothetical protein